MRKIKNSTRLLLVQLALATIISVGPIASPALEEDAASAQKMLTADELAVLEKALSEMKALAPELRVSLRSVRKQAGFDIHESHKLERNLSSTQRDMERLVAMHRRGAVSQMRAHFLVDDLRRKLQGLSESQGYVENHMQARQGQIQDTGEDNGLIVLLQRYTMLVKSTLSMLQEKGF